MVAFALPDGRADKLAQAAAQTFRAVGVLFAMLLGLLLVFAFARKTWFWYPMLAILITILTWIAWLVTETTSPTLLVMLGAGAIGSLLSVGRKRLRISR